MARTQPFCVAADSAMKNSPRSGCFRHVVKRVRFDVHKRSSLVRRLKFFVFKFRFYGKALKWNQRSLERGTAEKDEKIGGEKRPQKCAVKPNFTR